MNNWYTIFIMWLNVINKHGLRVLLCILLPIFGSSLGFAALELGEDTYIVINADEADPLHRAVQDLQRDFQVVSGYRPEVVYSFDEVPNNSPVILIAGPAWGDVPPLLPERLDGWESHALYVQEWLGHDCVVLQGYDMRGTLYALYTFSEEILGVPPLWFWASWKPESLMYPVVPAGWNRSIASPSVRYRAWFPNDQRLLSHWISLNRDKYGYVFETMLRLKLNTIDVLSHLDGAHRREYQLRSDAAHAKDYGLVLTTTHTAPLGAHPGINRWNNFWTRVKGRDTVPDRSIYDPETLIEYWTYHIEAAKHHELEMIWPIAFRGAGDLAFWQGRNYEDPGNDEDRGRVIREMLDRQIELIKTITGENKPLMRITLYNEKSDFLARGILELPEEPNLIYNFVAARRDHFPPPDLIGFPFTEDHLPGYYFNYQFTSTGSHIVQAESPAKMERNFRMIHELSPLGLYFGKVNAGNIREHIMELSANADMLWDMDNFDSSEFLKNFAATYFGEAYANEIASLMEDFYNAYWEQKPADMENFPRQYLFQDLRLQRSVRTLAEELAKDDVDLNPFMGGDWFRIDTDAHGVDTEVEAVVIGMRNSVGKLQPLAEQADTILQKLPESTQSFFNDNFRVQVYFLKNISSAVLYLGEALIAQAKGNHELRLARIQQAAKELIAMETILLEAEGGDFDLWYKPTRNSNYASMHRVWEQREMVEKLLKSIVNLP